MQKCLTDQVTTTQQGLETIAHLSSEESYNWCGKALVSNCMSASIRQAIKGIVTAGPSTSIRYAAEKVKKSIFTSNKK
jgi:hypothetical protein